MCVGVVVGLSSINFQATITALWWDLLVESEEIGGMDGKSS